MTNPILFCYRVELQTTSGAQNTAHLGDKYIDVDNGYLYVIVENLREVGNLFPDAVSVTRMGVGYQDTEY